MSSEKVLITGLGATTAFGSDLEVLFDKIFQGESCISKIEGFDASQLRCQIAGSIKDDSAILDKWKKYGKSGRFIVLGLEAASNALLDAGLIKTSDDLVDQSLNIGIVAGSGIGGLEEIYLTSKKLIEKGPSRVSPYFVPSALINLLPGTIAIKYGIKGVNQSQVTACATGAHAIADAARLIKEGRADIVLAGASEAAIGLIGLAGFDALRALSTKYNDNPSAASRPFDSNRDGFVMGEGAAILVLESESHAKKRGAKIYCEFKEAGLTADANHITAPCEDGDGAIRAMEEALARSGISKEKIDYINAHSTSTGLGDKAELKAIKKVFAGNLDDLAISSVKGSVGHLLGAAGALEALISVLSIKNQQLPPTINLEKADDEAFVNGKVLNLIPNKGINKKVDNVLSNAFGFGGVNISLLFSKYEG